MFVWPGVSSKQQLAAELEAMILADEREMSAERKAEGGHGNSFKLGLLGGKKQAPGISLSCCCGLHFSPSDPSSSCAC